jgi:LmbE family N-acetylglucosaminyl deacetylase
MKHLLAVFSHPDDETFRPGGTLALLAQSGVQVHVLTATRGEAGSCGEPPLCTPAELPGVRERELRCACAALGLQPPRLLGYEDGNLQKVEAESMVALILNAVDEIKPQVLLGFGPNGLSGHPDHIAIGRHTLAAFQRAEQVAALYTVAVPRSLAQKLDMRQVHPVSDRAIALTVDVSPVWETKLAAMRCHATQWSSLPMAQASEERRRLFFGGEYFVRAASRDADADFMPAFLQEHGL